MNYESLIFDIDGTLWDSRALVAEGYNAQLHREGLEHLCVDAERLKTLFGKVMTEIADALFESLPREERYPLLERCMESENAHLHESPCDIGFPGVKETLENWRKTTGCSLSATASAGIPSCASGKWAWKS